jgi:hypothetical protein
MPGEWDTDDERALGAGPHGGVDWDAELRRLLDDHREGRVPPGVVEEVPPAPLPAPGPALPWEGDDEWEPGRSRPERPAVVRLAAAVIAGALILGVIGGSLGLFIGAGSAPPLATLVTSVSPAPAGGAERVAFSVANRTDHTLPVLCVVEVFHGPGPVGSRTVRLASPVPGGGEASATVDVPVSGRPFDGGVGDAPACLNA